MNGAPAARAGLSLQAICGEVLKERYLRPGEHGEGDVFRRVAKALASVERPSERARYEALFLQNLNAGAIGAGRIMHAAGTSLRATLLNCFVQPVGDTLQGVDADAYPGIFTALSEAAQTLGCGGGVGYDFSRIRPRGALVASMDAGAAGPCAFMDVFDAACKALQSAGSRRGAQMGVLRIDHPDVTEFIEAKGAPGRWTSFNVSVGVPDAFMQAVADDGPWELVHRAQPLLAPGETRAQPRSDGLWVYARLRARALWDGVMRAAYQHGEPGVLFLDAIDRDNNLRYCERIEATNPCGEQPLPPYGCCDLGPLILPRFVQHPFGFRGAPAFDWAAFERAVSIQVRALDNVLDLSHWPLPQQGAQAQAKRRIGVGFTGLANALAMLRLRYDRQEGRDMASRLARAMRDTAYAASVSLAREKGAFPRFDADGYLAPGVFASRLPSGLQQAIRTHGIRNSHLLSIAPTGSVSLAFADNASNGIEPSFAWVYQRTKRLAAGKVRAHEVQDHAWRLYQSLGGRVDALPDYFVCAQDMDAGAHIAMLQAVQPYVDSAISKTVNVRPDVPYQDFHPLYGLAWRSGLKGLTAYRPDAARGPVLCVTCDRIPEHA